MLNVIQWTAIADIALYLFLLVFTIVLFVLHVRDSVSRGKITTQRLFHIFVILACVGMLNLPPYAYQHCSTEFSLKFINFCPDNISV